MVFASLPDTKTIAALSSKFGAPPRQEKVNRVGQTVHLF
jgi:hypothetical protein